MNTPVLRLHIAYNTIHTSGPQPTPTGQPSRHPPLGLTGVTRTTTYEAVGWRWNDQQNSVNYPTEVTKLNTMWI